MDRQAYSTPMGDIAYWVGGPESALTLVFLPGLTADHRLFDKQIEFFKPRHHCLVWDAPAHLESRPFSLDFTLEDWAHWLHEILQQEGIRRPVLIGQSMGGYLSQMFMELYPGEAAGFVCIDSAPLQRSYYAGWELCALKHTKLMYLSIPWSLLLSWGASGTATSEYGRQLMRQMMEGYGKVEYCSLAAHGYRMLAEAVEANRRYEITCPAQLICGDRDAAGSAKRYNQEWAARTGLPMVWLSGAGHNANTDAPAETNAIIEAFVAGLDR